MESVYKGKGCGPQALGSPNKMISKIAKVASKAKEIDQAYRKEAADAKKDPDYLKFMIDNEAPDSSNKKKANCWKGYKAVGKKKSPSGKKTKSGKFKMVNNCVKKK